jgi:integrase
MNKIRVRKRADGRYIYDLFYRGRRFRKITNLTKTETEQAAHTKLKELERAGLGLVDPGSRQEVLFETFADEFMEKYSKPKKRSWRRDETSLYNLKPIFKNKYLSRIGSDLVEGYLAERTKKVSPATANRELALLKTMFNKAADWGKIDLSPISKIKKFREENIKERILTQDEARRLIEAAKKELRPFLIIALNTGMRRNEILSLKWENVNFANEFILIESARSKSGKAKKVPMNRLVVEALKSIPKKHPLIFYNPETRRNIQDVKTAFRTALKKAKIKGVRLHDLRHTAATRMIEAGVDIATVSKILGHSSIQMTMRYCHPTEENMRRAVERLGESFNFALNPGKILDTFRKPTPKNSSLSASAVYN